MHHTAPQLVQDETPQARFDRLYITSREICETLGISRSAVLAARRRGLLPQGIPVNGSDVSCIYIWEREPLMPYLDAWRIVRSTRRNNQPSNPA